MVYKPKGSNNYWYKFRWQGEPIRESTKQTNKRIAEQMEAARKTQLAMGNVGLCAPGSAPTLKAFAPRFIQHIETECADRPATISFYKLKLKPLLLSQLAELRLGAIEERQIEDYIKTRRTTLSRHKKPLSPASVNRELATLRRMLRLAYRWKIISRVPAISLLRGEKHKETILTRAQEPLYLDVAPDPLQQVAVVLLDTGLRMRELLTLDWENVRLDPPSGAQYGYLTVLSGKAKNSKRRNVPLTARVDVLLRGIGVRRAGLVFCKPDGTPLCQTYLNEQARKVRTWLKLPADLTPHSFRHTFGTRLGESGADVFTIMKLMGHSSITISQRYVHPSPELIEMAFSRFEKLGVVIESGIVNNRTAHKDVEVV